MNRKYSYMGSKMDAYAGVVIPLFSLGSLGFAVFFNIIDPQKSMAKTIVICFYVLAALLLAGIAIKVRKKIYSWVRLEEQGIHVKILGSKEQFYAYTDFVDVGIGGYVNSGHSGAGIPVLYILFSDELVTKLNRENLNRWKMTGKSFRLGFSRERYDYLLMVMPPDHAQKLQAEYRELYGYMGDDLKYVAGAFGQKRESLFKDIIFYHSSQFVVPYSSAVVLERILKKVNRKNKIFYIDQIGSRESLNLVLSVGRGLLKLCFLFLPIIKISIKEKEEETTIDMEFSISGKVALFTVFWMIAAFFSMELFAEFTEPYWTISIGLMFLPFLIFKLSSRYISGDFYEAILSEKTGM